MVVAGSALSAWVACAISLKPCRNEVVTDLLTSCRILYRTAAVEFVSSSRSAVTVSVFVLM